MLKIAGEEAQGLSTTILRAISSVAGWEVLNTELGYFAHTSSTSV